LQRRDCCEKGVVKDEDDLTIKYTNADSLVNKMEALKLLVDSLDVKPNIIAITEVKSKHTKYHPKLTEFNISGDNVIHNDLDSEYTSRGIVVYINNKIDYSIIESKIKFKESLVIKIKTCQESIGIIGAHLQITS